MARPDYSVVGKGHQFSYRTGKRGPVAPGKIGAAACPDKKGVAGEQLTFGVQAYPVGRVAWSVKYFKFNLPGINDFVLVDPSVFAFDNLGAGDPA